MISDLIFLIRWIGKRIICRNHGSEGVKEFRSIGENALATIQHPVSSIQYPASGIWHLSSSFLLLSLSLSSCFSVKYSFSGASIPAEMSSVYVAYYNNRAQVINPNLSQQFTEALKEKFRSQTKLNVLNDLADGNFEGEITGYSTSPMAITGNETAAKNRFTISVRVKYTNVLDPKANFDQTFSRYEDYDSNRSFADVENELMKKIIDLLVEDIFNKAFVNW